MEQQAVLWNVDTRGVATVTLNRPQVNNAYDESLIQGLHDAMDALGGQRGLRVVVLRGEGKHFQAGADLKWIKSVAGQPPVENERVSRLTGTAVHRLNTHIEREIRQTQFDAGCVVLADQLKSHRIPDGFHSD